jgi:hypothetical protein
MKLRSDRLAPIALACMFAVSCSSEHRRVEPTQPAFAAAAPSAASTTAPQPSGGSSSALADAMRLLDAGDTRAARAALGRDPKNHSAIGLLHALDALDAAPNLFANVLARQVERPSFPTRFTPGARLSVFPKVQSHGGINREIAPAAVGTAPIKQASDAPPTGSGQARAAEDSGQERWPSSYAGLPLVAARAQLDGRWLLVYGQSPDRGRFVVVVDARGETTKVDAFDFSLFMDPPDSFNPRTTREFVTWAEVDGDELLVSNAHSDNPEASGGKNAYITAVHMPSAKVLWRSPGRVAYGESFVVTKKYVISGYEDYEEMQLFVIERGTGNVIGTTPLPLPPRQLSVTRGKLFGFAGDKQMILSGIEGVADREKERVQVAPMPKTGSGQANSGRASTLRAVTLSATQLQQRSDAIRLLDEGQFLAATKAFRALATGNLLAGNLVNEALLQASEQQLVDAREEAATTLKRSPFVTVLPPNKNEAAPWTVGPAFSLVRELNVANRPSRARSLFDERKVATDVIDKPYPGHLGELPEYVPNKLEAGLLWEARKLNDERLLGVYSGTTVLFDIAARRIAARYDFSRFGADAQWPQIGSFVMQGDTVVVTVRSPNAPLVAFHRVTGVTFWSQPLPLAKLMVVDGWLVGIAKGVDRGATVVVIDPRSGKIVQSVPSVRVDHLARIGDEILGDAPTSHASFRITRAK